MSVIHHQKQLLPTYLKGLCSGKYSLRQVAESTGYTIQHVCVLKKKYAMYGINCLVHGNKNKPCANRISQKLRENILLLYTTTYKGCNFQYFHDCLIEYENINVSITWLRGFLKENGFISPLSCKVKKKDKVNHRPRLRRQNEGDMIQLDGTPYAWFWKFGNDTRYCLTGSIDDATGKLTGLYFTDYECVYGYLEVLRQTITTHGVPREAYTDRAAIFCVNPKNKNNLTIWEQLEGVHEKRTQWQRILDELGIRQLLAFSPEAKGRVERMWLTIQNQLPFWLFVRGIDNIDKANKELHKYIKEFNSKYGKAPAIDDSFYLPCPDNLDDILQVKFRRKTDSVGMFSFHNEDFYVKAPRYRNILFDLCISERGIYAYIDDMYYPVYLKGCMQEVNTGYMSKTTKNIVYKYLYGLAKEVSV